MFSKWTNGSMVTVTVTGLASTLVTEGALSNDDWPLKKCNETPKFQVTSLFSAR